MPVQSARHPANRADSSTAREAVKITRSICPVCKRPIAMRLGQERQAGARAMCDLSVWEKIIVGIDRHVGVDDLLTAPGRQCARRVGPGFATV